MDNQHRQIKGYRELSQAEINLMNRIKAFGPQLQELIADVRAHINAQYDATHGTGDAAVDATVVVVDVPENERLRTAEPMRWASIAATELQTGLMALTRAVAQPTFF